jgi:multiple sugar transport system permease protein
MSTEKKRRKISVAEILGYAVLALGGLLILYPFYYAVLGSVSTVAEFNRAVFLPLPASPFAQLKNFGIVFRDPKLINALTVTALKFGEQCVVILPVSILCGYVFARVEFPFKSGFFMILLSSMMIPGIALLVPNYIWMAKFPLLGGNTLSGSGGKGFLDNPAVLFVPGLINVYFIFLCRQSFLDASKELGESARIDGAWFLTIVFRIYTPLIKPILAVMFLNLFIGNWNDYLTSIVYLPTATKYHTAGTVFSNYVSFYGDESLPGGPQFPKAFAAFLVAVVPPLAVFGLIQKSFVEGLALGAVKG